MAEGAEGQVAGAAEGQVAGAAEGRRRLVMALMFFPRGGSSHVTRNLAQFVPRAGWDVTLVSGSLGEPGEETHAATFFPGLDVIPVDYTAAYSAPDPFAANPPLHPSYEDRPGSPDRVFAALGDDVYERLVDCWAGALEAAGAGSADALHLHHLTPINEAAARAFPDVPVIGHVHGTELLMLEKIAAGAPAGWDHADAWAERMRRWAQACERVFVLSPEALERVPAMLGVDPARLQRAPNGFDPDGFQPRPVRGEERIAFWRRWLVDEPRGWDQSGEQGSVGYTEADLEAFADDAPVLVFVGRYTELKRIPLLIRAYAAARPRFATRAPLVLIGGHPGEWEGPHPLETVAETGAEDVFLAGWHAHGELADGLNAADLKVLPSVGEAFGQVLVEAMACGVPVIAANSHGPAAIVDDGETGWLVEPDDLDSLADALVEAVNDSDERARRGEAALRAARERYSWPALAEQVAGLYDTVAAEHRSAEEGARP